MEYIIDDDYNYENSHNNLNSINKLKSLNNNINKNDTPKFLCKEEREKLKQEEEKIKAEEKKKKELENKINLKKYINSKYDHDNNRNSRDDYDSHRKESKYNKRSRSNSRDKKLYRKDDSNKNKIISENLEDKEKDEIKNYYLGLNKEKRKMIKPSEKFKNIFNFSWDKEEDTSADINPIYKNQIEPHLLFGRGTRGGFDIKEQKKKTKEYEKMLLKDREEFNQDDKHKRKRSRSRNRKDYSSSDDSNSRSQSEEDNLIHWSEKKKSEMTERDWRIFREDNDIIIKGGRVPIPMRNWSEANLPEYILNTIKEIGYKKPSPIQMQGIPIGIERRDMIGLAPTGSGKSAAFLIPLIVYLNTLPPINPTNSHLGPYALIIAPSRELALQIHEEFKKFAESTKLKAACLVGGRSGEEQCVQLGMGVEVIIGTPGRIQDSLDRHYTTLNQCHYLILDEADKMIKEDFEESLNYILDCIPVTNLKSDIEEEQENQLHSINSNKFRITMMFSATMNPQLEKLAKKYLRCPSYISIGEPGMGKKEIEQKVEFVGENEKKERLKFYLNKFKNPIIIFVNHKKEVDYLCKYLLKCFYRATPLHGGKNQHSREKAMKGFKMGKFDILVCTNVAARGIDVEGVTLVVNYDCPDNIDDYTHRIGRTGRAKMKGVALTFITNKDEIIFYDLAQFLEKNNQIVPNELLNHPASKNKFGKKQNVLYTN